MKFLLILLLLGVFAAKASSKIYKGFQLNAQEQDEGELSQEYPEEYPAAMVDEDEVLAWDLDLDASHLYDKIYNRIGELQEESEDELSEDELADGMIEGEKPVSDGYYRAGMRGGRIIWKYRRPIRHVAKRVFSAFRRGRRRKFRRELQEDSEDQLMEDSGHDFRRKFRDYRRRRRWRRELQEESEEEFSEDSEEMEIADGEDKVSDDIIFTGGIAAATLAYRNRNKIGRWERRTSKKIRSWFRRRSRNGFRRSLAVEEEEEVSDDDVIACFGMYKGNSPGECNKIKRVGRHVGGWFKRHGIRRRYVVPQNDPRFLFFHGRRRKVRYGKSFNVGRRRRRRYVGRKGGF